MSTLSNETTQTPIVLISKLEQDTINKWKSKVQIKTEKFSDSVSDSGDSLWEPDQDDKPLTLKREVHLSGDDRDEEIEPDSEYDPLGDTNDNPSRTAALKSEPEHELLVETSIPESKLLPKPKKTRNIKSSNQKGPKKRIVKKKPDKVPKEKKPPKKRKKSVDLDSPKRVADLDSTSKTDDHETPRKPKRPKIEYDNG